MPGAGIYGNLETIRQLGTDLFVEPAGAGGIGRKCEIRRHVAFSCRLIECGTRQDRLG